MTTKNTKPQDGDAVSSLSSSDMLECLRALLKGLECQNIDRLLTNTDRPELFQAIGEKYADQCIVATAFLPSNKEEK